MRASTVIFVLLLMSVGVAFGDTWTELLPDGDYIDLDDPMWSAHAAAINSSGWVVGYIDNTVSGYGSLWIPSGQKSIKATPLQDPWAEWWYRAVDVHDNGDILIEAFTPAPIPPGECSDPPCVSPEDLGNDARYSVYHAGGGPVFSSKNYFRFGQEWLSDPSVWGPSGSRNTNSAGQYIESAVVPVDGQVTIHSWLVTPSAPVPEPSSLILLLPTMCGLGLAARRRASKS